MHCTLLYCIDDFCGIRRISGVCRLMDLETITVTSSTAKWNLLACGKLAHVARVSFILNFAVYRAIPNFHDIAEHSKVLEKYHLQR